MKAISRPMPFKRHYTWTMKDVVNNYKQGEPKTDHDKNTCGMCKREVEYVK